MSTVVVFMFVIDPTDNEATHIVTTDFVVHLDDRRIQRDGRDVRLTPTEWRLVEMLARRPGHLVSQTELLEAVWGPSAITKTCYLRVHMASIRRKLEPEPARPRYFITAPGLGLRFDPTGSGANGSGPQNRTPKPGSVRK